jgi:hypothetical protein
MVNPNPTSLRSGTPTLSRRISASAVAKVGADQLKVWCLRALTVLSFGYIVASQGLAELPGWSRLGFLLAALLVSVLTIGRLTGTLRFRSVGLVWVSLLFVGFCVVRAVPETGGDWPLDALFKIASAFIGAIGIGLALQAGVPFKAVVWAQTITILANMGAGFFGVGSEAPNGTDLDRFSGLTGNANELALQLTLGACLIWLSPRKAGRLPCWLAVGAVVYAFLTTGSRKSLLSVPVFIFLVLLQLASVAKKRHVFMALVLIGPLLILAVVLGPMIFEHAKTVPTVQRALTYEGDSSYNKRLEMVHVGLRLWQSSPVLGRGTDAFTRLSGFDTYAHNNFMELLCDLGVLGALLFYGIHFFIILKCLRLPMPLKLYCVIFVLMLVGLDLGTVSYYRKQTIMIMMILASVAAAPEILLPPRRRKQQAPPIGSAYPQVPLQAHAGR